VLSVYLFPQYYPLYNYEGFSDKYKKINTVLGEMQVDEVYPALRFLLNQVDEIVELEKLLDHKPTNEQVRAGIKNFNVLGDFNTIDMLADGDPLKYDSILKLPYNTIFNKLYKNKISSTF